MFFYRNIKLIKVEYIIMINKKGGKNKYEKIILNTKHSFYANFYGLWRR